MCNGEATSTLWKWQIVESSKAAIHMYQEINDCLQYQVSRVKSEEKLTSLRRSPRSSASSQSYAEARRRKVQLPP